MTTKLDKVLEDIKKKFGNTAILRGNDTVKDVQTISTSCLSVDEILGGGVPKGFITEVFGKEGTGKSTLAAHIVAEAQKLGGCCAYVDTENAVNSEYFKAIGVDMDDPNKWLMCQPTSAEEALSLINLLIESNEVSTIIVDSVPAMIPEAVLNGEIQDQHIAQLPRLLSRVLPRIVNALSKSQTALIFINQLRDNIGNMSSYGPKTITPGGHALRYYANVRIELSRIGAVKNGEEIIGSKIKLRTMKNKISSPFKEVSYDLIFGMGISSDRDAVDQLIKKDIINKGGSWLTYITEAGEEVKFQGLEKFVSHLKENPDLKEELYNKLKD